MEACATSHFWGRFASGYGHEVRLIPPVYGKPVVKRQKNNAVDAAAIAEADLRPNVHYAAVKRAEHQAPAVAFTTHQCPARQRTQFIKAARPPRRVGNRSCLRASPSHCGGHLADRTNHPLIELERLASITWARSGC